jgi:NhaP-type Na+/H+ or K+/H+ antiporter
MTITIVAVSIVVHGLTSQPLMKWYDRQQSRRAQPQESDESRAAAIEL